MTETGKKKRPRRRQTPKKEPSPDNKSEYTLVYKNPRPDPVKPKRNPDKPKGNPVFFIMEHSHIYDGEDDTL